jgi:hypothetical protein
MVGNLRDCGLQQAYRAASVEERRCVCEPRNFPTRPRHAKFPTDECPFSGTHGTSNCLFQMTAFCDNSLTAPFFARRLATASSVGRRTTRSAANVLIRLTAPLEIAGVVVAIVLMTHSPADAQALKPVAVHAAQSPSAGQATARRQQSVRRREHVRHLPRPEVHGNRARSEVERANTRRQHGMRKLPRPGKGARRRRR